MSSLINLPCGETLDYWWEKLKDRPRRKRFLLTKVLEVLTYKLSARGTRKAQPPSVKSVLQLKPQTLRNGIQADSKLAVVIPARCSSQIDGDLLKRLTLHLRGQKAAVFVVNDGSSHWPELNADIHILVHERSRGPAAARNTAIAAALNSGAEVILFTDVDCIPEHDWVAEAVNGFIENPYAHALSGRTVSANSTWFDKYHDINGTLNGRRFKHTNILLYGPTCNLAISRTLAQTITFDNAFPTSACEDIDFCCRVMEAGFRVMHRRSMVISHDYQFQHGRWLCNMSRFVRQFRKYASAESILLGKYPAYHPYFGQTEEISNDAEGAEPLTRRTPNTSAANSLTVPGAIG